MNYKKIKEYFNTCEIINNKIYTNNNNIKELLFLLKEQFKYNMLQEIITIDHKNDSLELIYKLYSTENEEELLISKMIENNEIESITDIFSSGIADENEIYDLFGIQFIGNKSLKRLYMPESWQGHPLRKDYVQCDERLKWNE